MSVRTAMRGAGLVSAGAVTALAVAALVTVAPEASSRAPDTTAPVAQIRPRLDVGSQVVRQPDYICEDSESSTVGFVVRYSATDPSGVSRYNRWDVYGDGEPDGGSAWWYGDDAGQLWHGALTDYRGDCGFDSGDFEGWAITAYDDVDNAKYVDIFSQPVVFQQDGVSLESAGGSVTATRTGTWRTATGSWASGGSQMWTEQQGATATWRVPVEGNLGGIGLVMAQGPGRGRFQVRVDGTLVATVDSLAAANRNRVVVWQAHVAAGTHTLTVRNLATTGRPRIDVDAVVSYSPHTW